MTYNPMSLAGKTILVTGASSGIGRAIAIECSRLGGRVIGTARNEARLAETMEQMEGNNHIMISADITTDKGIAELVSQLSHLDGVAHVAGMDKLTPSAFLKRSNIEPIMELNLYAPMMLQALLLKKKFIKNGASLLFISSISGIAGQTGQSAYAASKAGLIAYMKVLTQELSSRNIRANCILPGMVETPLIYQVHDEANMDADMAKYPLHRYGKPEEIAHLAAFLLSDAAAWITGSNYVIDGGLTRR